MVRDREIERLKSEAGTDFGSGYLADEKTQIFLRRNFDDVKFTGLFRESWEPFKSLVREKEQKTLEDF